MGARAARAPGLPGPMTALCPEGKRCPEEELRKEVVI